MANTIKLIATKRVANGSGEARRVRRAGAIPAALTRLTRETDTIQLNAHDYMMAMRNEASEQVLVDLELDGVVIPAILREVQHDVISGEPTHADFAEVDMNRKIRANVTLHLVGDPEGVRNQGGVLSQSLHEITVECLPSKLVESFDIDVTGLKLNADITVGELNLGSDYLVLTAADSAVASVTAVAEEAAAAEGDAQAAPEVLAKGKKEEDAGAKAKK